jgi:hypothetical protein
MAEPPGMPTSTSPSGYPTHQAVPEHYGILKVNNTKIGYRILAGAAALIQAVVVAADLYSSLRF